MKLFLLLLLLPSLMWAQRGKEVEPILSKDYAELIRKNKAVKNNNTPGDSTNSMRKADLTTDNYMETSLPIKKIIIKNKNIRVKNNYTKRLSFGGNYNSTVEFKTINRLPSLQKEYVQGSPVNGALAWRGPETGELFSYGPGVNSLEFDGSTYPYDVNGRLVTKGAGNGNPAKAYRNSIFRTAVLFSQSFTLKAKLRIGWKREWNFNMNLGKTSEKTFIKNNKNNSGNLSASLGTNIDWLHIMGSYTYLHNRLSNGNRNGFLNRAYQNSILTPISFENAQGNMIGNEQRRYSDLADNPFFLLKDNGNSFNQSQNTGNLTLEKKVNNLRFKIVQSISSTRQLNNEAYKAGTAWFENGIATQRKQNNRIYFLRANISRRIEYTNSDFESTASLNYLLADSRSSIKYTNPLTSYSYQRSSHDIALDYYTHFRSHNFSTGIYVGNKFYLSNTASKNAAFLPFVNGFIRFDRLAKDLTLKITSSLIRFNSELPIDKSYAHINLLGYGIQEAMSYFPVREILSFNNLRAVRHKEWTGSLELSYRNKYSFRGEFFTRKTRDDIFPIEENGNLVLKNIADHRKYGIELELSAAIRTRTLEVTNRLSFTNWQNKVTGVRDGYNFTPIAGFNNINKAVVNGEVLGAITGSSFARDVHNNIVIGADGYPLVNNQRTVIGNPLPDFVMKLSNSLTWKRIFLSVDWQWQNGGEIWNGTQAVLDYHGRSQNSATLRNTTGYVFPGVLEDGHINTIPVNFYDPSQPITQNRWVRYGLPGVTEEYIQKADHIKLNTLSVGYRINFKKYLQKLTISAYVNNLIIWSAYKGVDPNQLLYDQPDTSGLDFFNLPSTKVFGLFVILQF